MAPPGQAGEQVALAHPGRAEESHAPTHALRVDLARVRGQALEGAAMDLLDVGVAEPRLAHPVGREGALLDERLANDEMLGSETRILAELESGDDFESKAEEAIRERWREVYEQFSYDSSSAWVHGGGGWFPAKVIARWRYDIWGPDEPDEEEEEDADEDEDDEDEA